MFWLILASLFIERPADCKQEYTCISLQLCDYLPRPASATFCPTLQISFWCLKCYRTWINHRIIEWFGLEVTLKISWFQPPCHEQGHLPLDQVAQSPIQPGLEHFQGGASTASLGNLLQCTCTTWWSLCFKIIGVGFFAGKTGTRN